MTDEDPEITSLKLRRFKASSFERNASPPYLIAEWVGPGQVESIFFDSSDRPLQRVPRSGGGVGTRPSHFKKLAKYVKKILG